MSIFASFSVWAIPDSKGREIILKADLVKIYLILTTLYFYLEYLPFLLACFAEENQLSLREL